MEAELMTNENLLDHVHFREPTEEDLPLIFSSWLKSYRNSDFAKSINKTDYFKYHHKIIEGLLEDSTVILACDVKDPATIFGYIVVAKINGAFTVHYLYVKHTYRKFGIAKLLFNVFQHEDGEELIYTHETPIVKKIAPKYRFTYNPYLIVVESDKVDDGETSN